MKMLAVQLRGRGAACPGSCWFVSCGSFAGAGLLDWGGVKLPYIGFTLAGVCF